MGDSPQIMAAVFQVKRYMMQYKKYIATVVSLMCFVYMAFINLLKLALNYKKKKERNSRHLQQGWFSHPEVELK